ncbi:hypothetical protein PIB30_097970 [Stylosanthes scabra]|uniref:Uncharacterized protein n=1 Tax=Stylosanthes scabra TaxID=79078 RepID=A0ABU6ZV40_9FABA|nr:hypothetical protein [Stylosanthes scabra]
MARKAHSPLAKGKAKIHQLPTRFSLRLATLTARQPIDKVGPSVSTPAAPDPIIISSDSEEDLEPKGGNSEEEDPEIDPEGEDQGDPEEPEEDLEEDPEEDPEMEEEEAEVMEPDEDEYNEYFANYFELGPPPSPYSSVGSPPPTDA